MKIYLTLFALLIGLHSVADAQSQKMPTAQELTQKSIKEMEEKLKLSTTQKSVIYNYTFELYKQQLDLVKRQQAGTSREEDVAKFYKFQNDTNNNIKTILKGEQIAQFEQLLEDRLNGDAKKKNKKGKKKKGEKEEEVSTGISGLVNPEKP